MADGYRDLVATAFAVLAGLGIEPAIAFSAAIGSVIATYLFDEGMPPRETSTKLRRHRLAVVFGGTAIGTYCTPLLLAAASVEEQNLRISVGAGFVVALVGMAIAAGVLRSIREVDGRKIIESWLKRK